MRTLALCVSLGLVLVMATGAAAARKKPPPHQPPPPPDTADDCTFVAEAPFSDYLVLSFLNVGVQCATVKRSISVTSQLTRNGVVVPILPLGAESPTCTNTTSCVVSFDLFSFDNHPVAFPGDQLYCGSGSGVVGGRVIGPGSACETDSRL
jgi:hypothetical protein